MDKDLSAEDQSERLKHAVGDCLLMWANVEFNLAIWFRRHQGPDARVANAIWGSVVSFDARITMLQGILKLRFQDPSVSRDITLLLNEARRLYRWRNEIAHATLVFRGNDESDPEPKPALEPFLNLGEPSRRLSYEDVNGRRDRFGLLLGSLIWLEGTHLSPARIEPQISLPQRPTGLVQELRSEESRKSTEQRERARLLRLAQKLQAEGGLPDE